jgi:phosphatidyl-myo-inositol dimannoside synthase
MSASSATASRDRGRSVASTILPRIILLTELFPPAVGGSAVLFENVYRRLAGHDVDLLTSTPGDEGPRAFFRSVTGIQLDGRARGFVRPSHLGQHLGIARRLRAMSRQAASVVHCGRGLPEGAAAYLASFAPSGPPYICWVHGEEVAAALTSREHSLLLRRVFRRAAALIANSENTRRFVQSAGLRSGAIAVAYPGVDADVFHPSVDPRPWRQRLGVKPAEVLLLSVGRLQRRKGHDLVIRALATMPGESRPRYLIVGDGEERQALGALAAEAGVGANVVFAGEVESSELPSCYAACDIFLMPNRTEGTDFEGFGIVFLEAAATGKPVIAGRSGGAPEAVSDGVNGILVGGHDERELAGAVAGLAASAERRSAMGRAGRQRAVAEFSWEKTAEVVARVHQDVAASRQAFLAPGP